VPHHLLLIQTTPSLSHAALVTALDPILGVTMPRVAETVQTFINGMIHGTNFELVNLLHAESANLTHKDLNNSIDKQQN
jgi:hypothetical protein